MKLTKKNQRHIRNVAVKDVWTVNDHASEYVLLYQIAYYKEVLKNVQEKINYLEDKYNKTYNNKAYNNG